MSNKPRFDAKAFTTPVVTPTDAPSASAVRQKALDDFTRASLNVLMLGPTLRPHSSFTRDAVAALVTLIIAERRMRGGHEHISAADMLNTCGTPPELHSVLLEGMEAQMQRRLAQQPETVAKADEAAIRADIVNRMRESFGSTN